MEWKKKKREREGERQREREREREREKKSGKFIGSGVGDINLAPRSTRTTLCSHYGPVLKKMWRIGECKSLPLTFFPLAFSSMSRATTEENALLTKTSLWGLTLQCGVCTVKERINRGRAQHPLLDCVFFWRRVWKCTVNALPVLLLFLWWAFSSS